jgi:putative transposase
MESYQIVEGARLYDFAFTVVEWLPVFVSEQPCLISSHRLNDGHRHNYLRINAFVIMPTHLHPDGV